jgi:hypothetical protein
MIHPASSTSSDVKPIPVYRPQRCRRLLKRTEFKAGCGGWMCRHECEKNFPAVPGDYCQRCPAFLTEADEEPETVVVNMSAGGLGDALLTMLAVRGLADDHPGQAITYRVHPHAIPFIELFDSGAVAATEHEYDNIRPELLRPSHGPLNRQVNLDYEQEAPTKAAVPRYERFRRNVGASACRIPTLRDPERIRAIGERWAGAVVLAPFSNGPDREYHLQGWRSLVKELQARGYRVIVTDLKPEKCDLFPGIEAVAGRSAEEVAGLLSRAAVVIGNDSGITHLGGVLGVPTIALCGQTDGTAIFGLYPAVRILTGHLACNGCWWMPANGWHQDCHKSCPSLQTILPREIADAVDWIHLPRVTEGRAVIDPMKLVQIRRFVQETNGIEGELAELGVYQGGVARLISDVMRPGSTLHLFDTFEGIPEDDVAPGGHRKGDFATRFEDVQDFLRGRPVVFHRGWFPQVLPPDPIRYRFAHVDMDTYQSTIAALDYLLPRMVPGGVVVFDDYGWFKCQGVQQALHEIFPPERIHRVSDYQAAVRF